MKFLDWSAIINNNAPSIDFAPAALPLRRTVWLIFTAAAAILLVFLGSNVLSGSEEDVAEGIRELLAGADIFSGNAWWDHGEKFPLWFCRLQALPGMVMGNSEIACRLLTVLSALFLLAGVMFLTEDLFDRQVMCCTAWMLIGSCGFIFWGRTACSFITLSSWVVWSAVLFRSGEKLFIRQFFFFILLFSGTAWWGMNYLLALPGAAVAALDKRWLKPSWRIVPAIVAALLIVSVFLAWSVGTPSLPYAEYPGRLWRQITLSFMESWQIAVWRGGVFNLKLMLNLPRMLFPWTLPVFFAMVWMAWNWRELDNTNRRLLCGSLLILLCTGVFPLRRWSYQLSMLPFMLMIGGSWLSGTCGGEKWQNFANTVMKWVLSLGCSFAASVILMYPVWKIFFAAPMPWGIMLIVPLLGLAGLAFMIFDTGAVSGVEKVSGMNGSWSGYILAGVCFSAALFSITVPEIGNSRNSKVFWADCGRDFAQLPPEEVVFFGNVPSAKSMYYMNLPRGISVVYSREELTAALKKISTGEGMIVAELKNLPLIESLLRDAGWKFLSDKPQATESGRNTGSDIVAAADLKQWVRCRIIRGITQKK